MTTPAEDPIRALYRKTQEAKKNVHPWLFGLPALTELATKTDTDDDPTDTLPPAA